MGSYPFIQAYHHGGPQPAPRWIVIHATVSACAPGVARNVANYFARPDIRPSSAHYVIDPGEIIQSVREDTIAWHAPPISYMGSIGLEHTDPCDVYPVGSSDWVDADHRAMLARSAGLAREICDRYSIPVRRVGPNDMKAGRGGFCSHDDVSKAWGQSQHWDPGTSFPWDQYLSLIKGTSGGGTPGEDDDDMTPEDRKLLNDLKERLDDSEWREEQLLNMLQTQIKTAPGFRKPADYKDWTKRPGALK